MITTRHKLTRYGTSLAVVLGVHAVAIIIALATCAGLGAVAYARRRRAV